MSISQKLYLLIQEIDPSTHNGRFLRENLRRIKLFADALIDGTIQVGSAAAADNAQSAISAFTRYEAQVATSDGQTVFTLADTPTEPGKVNCMINSCEVTNGVHFTVTGNTVTLIPAALGFELEVNNELGFADKLLFSYIVI